MWLPKAEERTHMIVAFSLPLAGDMNLAISLLAVVILVLVVAMLALVLAVLSRR
jgi:hypothetical protein